MLFTRQKEREYRNTHTGDTDMAIINGSYTKSSGMAATGRIESRGLR